MAAGSRRCTRKERKGTVGLGPQSPITAPWATATASWPTGAPSRSSPFCESLRSQRPGGSQASSRWLLEMKARRVSSGTSRAKSSSCCRRPTRQGLPGSLRARQRCCSGSPATSAPAECSHSSSTATSPWAPPSSKAPASSWKRAEGLSSTATFWTGAATGVRLPCRRCHRMSSSPGFVQTRSSAFERRWSTAQPSALQMAPEPSPPRSRRSFSLPMCEPLYRVRPPSQTVATKSSPACTSQSPSRARREST
mmetsp:Transcript_43733/g.139336  ORF Transcript_43733/g.139336 Transcript_43733/m.139336 type:complete len:252 (-) Transcript_43733:421-1176(-)